MSTDSTGSEGTENLSTYMTTLETSLNKGTSAEYSTMQSLRDAQAHTSMTSETLTSTKSLITGNITISTASKDIESSTTFISSTETAQSEMTATEMPTSVYTTTENLDTSLYPIFNSITEQTTTTAERFSIESLSAVFSNKSTGTSIKGESKTSKAPTSVSATTGNVDTLKHSAFNSRMTAQKEPSEIDTSIKSSTTTFHTENADTSSKNTESFSTFMSSTETTPIKQSYETPLSIYSQHLTHNTLMTLMTDQKATDMKILMKTSSAALFTSTSNTGTMIKDTESDETILPKTSEKHASVEITTENVEIMQQSTSNAKITEQSVISEMSTLTESASSIFSADKSGTNHGTTYISSFEASQTDTMASESPTSVFAATERNNITKHISSETSIIEEKAISESSASTQSSSVTSSTDNIGISSKNTEKYSSLMSTTRITSIETKISETPASVDITTNADTSQHSTAKNTLTEHEITSEMSNLTKSSSNGLSAEITDTVYENTEIGSTSMYITETTINKATSETPISVSITPKKVDNLQNSTCNMSMTGSKATSELSTTDISVSNIFSTSKTGTEIGTTVVSSSEMFPTKKIATGTYSTINTKTEKADTTQHSTSEILMQEMNVTSELSTFMQTSSTALSIDNINTSSESDESNTMSSTEIIPIETTAYETPTYVTTTLPKIDILSHFSSNKRVTEHTAKTEINTSIESLSTIFSIASLQSTESSTTSSNDKTTYESPKSISMSVKNADTSQFSTLKTKMTEYKDTSRLSSLIEGSTNFSSDKTDTSLESTENNTAIMSSSEIFSTEREAYRTPSHVSVSTGTAGTSQRSISNTRKTDQNIEMTSHEHLTSASATVNVDTSQHPSITIGITKQKFTTKMNISIESLSTTISKDKIDTSQSTKSDTTVTPEMTPSVESASTIYSTDQTDTSSKGTESETAIKSSIVTSQVQTTTYETPLLAYKTTVNIDSPQHSTSNTRMTEENITGEGNTSNKSSVTFYSDYLGTSSKSIQNGIAFKSSFVSSPTQKTTYKVSSTLSTTTRNADNSQHTSSNIKRTKDMHTSKIQTSIDSSTPMISNDNTDTSTKKIESENALETGSGIAAIKRTTYESPTSVFTTREFSAGLQHPTFNTRMSEDKLSSEISTSFESSPTAFSTGYAGTSEKIADNVTTFISSSEIVATERSAYKNPSSVSKTTRNAITLQHSTFNTRMTEHKLASEMRSSIESSSTEIFNDNTDTSTKTIESDITVGSNTEITLIKRTTYESPTSVSITTESAVASHPSISNAKMTEDKLSSEISTPLESLPTAISTDYADTTEKITDNGTSFMPSSEIFATERTTCKNPSSILNARMTEHTLASEMSGSLKSSSTVISYDEYASITESTKSDTTIMTSTETTPIKTITNKPSTSVSITTESAVILQHFTSNARMTKHKLLSDTNNSIKSSSAVTSTDNAGTSSKHTKFMSSFEISPTVSTAYKMPSSFFATTSTAAGASQYSTANSRMRESKSKVTSGLRTSIDNLSNIFSTDSTYTSSKSSESSTEFIYSTEITPIESTTYEPSMSFPTPTKSADTSQHTSSNAIITSELSNSVESTSTISSNDKTDTSSKGSETVTTLVSTTEATTSEMDTSNKSFSTPFSSLYADTSSKSSEIGTRIMLSSVTSPRERATYETFSSVPTSTENANTSQHSTFIARITKHKPISDISTSIESLSTETDITFMPNTEVTSFETKTYKTPTSTYLTTEKSDTSEYSISNTRMPKQKATSEISTQKESSATAFSMLFLEVPI